MDQLTYRVGNGLYVNTTNRCTMDCTFCIRSRGSGIGNAPDLWLSKEHSREEILKDILRHDPGSYNEIVFCGFGEPTERLMDILYICGELKKQKNPPVIRIDTNGHASLIAGKDVTPLFEGLFDSVSISLNAPTAGEYEKLCRPEAGEEAFYAMLEFASKVKEYVPQTYLSVVDVLPPEKLAACREIADGIGVPLRVRHLI
ncbi:MAG: TatD family nuclease-associated radical SAM protein [Bacillota bacterium]|nr:TatD family nuclease-associated radical SAM protein [Bacillota bacterium]